MRRLRGQDGFTMVPVIITMSIVMAMGAAALAMAWRSIGTSNHDRFAAQALAAADAGADVAAYRMNKSLVSNGTAGILGFAIDTLHTVACLQVSAGSWVITQTQTITNGFCQATPEEGAGDGATFHTQMSTGALVGSTVSQILTRKIVSTGTAGGVTRRVLVVYKLDISNGNPLRLFKRWRYSVCTSKPPVASNPTSGCPDPGT